MTPIRWDLVASAIRYYEGIGYRYLEVPWVIREDALAATLPPGHEATRCQDGPLVGSAEQAFLHLMLEGQMPEGRFVAATPCFRDDAEDELHQRRFFKVELIDYFGAAGALREGIDPDKSRVINSMARDAERFFRRAGAKDAQIVLVDPTGPDFLLDIELGGVELGSYGYRQVGGHQWIYGTGFAEPRFSVALQKWRGDP